MPRNIEKSNTFKNKYPIKHTDSSLSYASTVASIDEIRPMRLPPVCKRGGYKL
jgi:hypothetical protein